MINTINNNNRLLSTAVDSIKNFPVKSLVTSIYHVAVKILSHNITHKILIGCVSIKLGRLISNKIFEYKKNNFWQKHTKNPVSNSDVVLVLETTDDHNGAFLSFKFLKKLESKTHKLILKKISTIHEINTAVYETIFLNNKIKGIVIRAHGSPDFITLSKKEDFTKGIIFFRNAHLLASSFTKLDDNTSIILESCLTAGTPEVAMIDIAREISAVAPRCKIIACSHSPRDNLIKYKKDEPLDTIEFWSTSHNNITVNTPTSYLVLKSKIVSIWNKFFGPTFNATVIYEPFH